MDFITTFSLVGITYAVVGLGLFATIRRLLASDATTGVVVAAPTVDAAHS